MDNIKFTPQDILHKQFKERNIGKGYDEADVDAFLDDVIKDYDTYNKEIERLNDDNERLRAKVDELNRQVEVGSSMSNQTASRQPVSSATNMDILKRLSNLERRVFGSQLDGNENNNDSHLL
ncbi:cell division regulator GpsB [uncultured Limosilactobacillus sp.]|uniref:cell division regulator GpsB n=1 Tax=uncultured Limosilactobacillus sp. TaxID=2837629 RepID=UPI001655A5C2|nr:cell division regulator GpsB [uncultured Limosilactobacillus sp.]MBC8744764.1 cell division regulator GpsB [Lactobacillus sp. Marseille-P7033]